MRVSTYVEVNIYYTKYITMINMYYDIYYISLELLSSQYDACFLHLFLILLLPRYSREPLQLFVSKEKKKKREMKERKKEIGFSYFVFLIYFSRSSSSHNGESEYLQYTDCRPNNCRENFVRPM